MLIYEGNLHKKIWVISQLGAEKITFPPKPDGQTDIQTDGRTDISVYRVETLLKQLPFFCLSLKRNFDLKF